jgi:hypothetical protein
MIRHDPDVNGAPRLTGRTGARSVTLRCRAPARPGAEVRDREMRLDGVGDPRRLVGHLARSAGLGIADARVDGARVDGLDGLWAELLLLAWMHDPEVGFNRVAEALLTLDDARLAVLRGRSGSFDRAFALRIARVLVRAEGDPALDGLSLAGLLAWASPQDGADLDALEARLGHR